MNILVTGVTSFVGRALVKELIAEGYDVYGVIRPDSKNKRNLPKKLHIVTCDMSEADTMEKMNLPPMYACVHLAWDGVGKEGRANPDIQKLNKENTYKLIKVSKKLGCERFVFAGSQAEYGITLRKVKSGECPSDEIDESFECAPLSEYGKAKLEVLEKASALCKNLDMTYLHFRLYSAYGSGDHETSLVSSCVKAFEKDSQISLSSCEQMWNFINVRDAAKAIADLASCVVTFTEEDVAEEHIINIAGEDTRPLKEFVEEIHKIIGKGSFDFARPAEAIAEGTPYLNPSINRLKALTGFKQTISFEEGIKEIEKVYSMRSKPSRKAAPKTKKHAGVSSRPSAGK